MYIECLIGTISRKSEHWVSDNWDRILRAHQEEFPELKDFFPGSFNICLTAPENWRPPNEGFFYGRSRERGLEMRNRLPDEEWHRVGGDFLACGNFIHPQIRGRSINGTKIDGLLYFKGIRSDY